MERVWKLALFPPLCCPGWGPCRMHGQATSPATLPAQEATAVLATGTVLCGPNRPGTRMHQPASQRPE